MSNAGTKVGWLREHVSDRSLYSVRSVTLSQ